MLDAWLEFHRATLLVKCDGLSPEQLRERAVPPSSISLLGLVRHMADVERNWFRRVLGGEDVPGLFWTDDNEDGDFDDVDGADVEADFATYRAEVDRARALAAGAPLETIAIRRRRRPPLGGPAEEEISLRWIMVHMVEEYARHNGHADFLRERLDGSVGD